MWRSLLRLGGRWAKITKVAAKPAKAKAAAKQPVATTEPKLTLWSALTTWVKSNPREAALVAVLLAVSILAHAWNMFHFPYYENDEATYTSRAWMFITEGQLDVYTYRYDHAPLGWMLLGFWQLITGAQIFFNSLVENGRILMLLLHIGSTLLVYALARRFSGGSKLAGTLAVLFFALSPLGIFFHRRILLDNIMTFWLLASVFFATQPIPRLKNYILSALTFGIAVLTKLNAIFLGPAILFMVWVSSHKRHKLHASAYWLTVAGMVVAGFFMYALLKGELLPAPLDANGQPTHVSVADTFALQLGRGEFALPWKPESSLVQNTKSWLLKDWSILTIGAVASVGVAAVGWRRRKTQPYILGLALLIGLYMAFLGRGKLVIDLYIVPLLPLLAVAIGVMTAVIYRDWLHKRFFKRLFMVSLVAGLVLVFAGLPNHHYWRDETANQLAAVEWVRRYVPKDAIIATDNYMYPFLAQEDDYKNVSYFFSTEYDPEIRATYQDDWRNVEYLILTHEIVKQIKTGTIPNMKHVLDHSVLLADYRADTSSFINLSNYISTNGDWAQIYKVKDRSGIVLQDSWQHFKSNFIVSYGQVVDLTNGSLSTSTAQAQAMLRAVAENDAAMFSGLWQWSKDHLRYRAGDKLLSWKWELQPDGTYKLADSNTVCDADQQIAYALFLADEKWPGTYGQEAAVHLSDWWRECTFDRGGLRLVDSSADGSQDSRLINTGYFRPALYDYFLKKAPDLQWQRLIDDSYTFLGSVYAQYGTIPDWTVLNVDGSLAPASTRLDATADKFGYDTLELVPSLLAAAHQTDDARARELLAKLQTPVAQFALATKSPSIQSAELLLAQALLPRSGSPQAIQAAYEQFIHRPYNSLKGHWYDGYNYRDQVWLWQWHESQHNLETWQRVNLR